jgi:hypothetical protein
VVEKLRKIAWGGSGCISVVPCNWAHNPKVAGSIPPPQPIKTREDPRVQAAYAGWLEQIRSSRRRPSQARMSCWGVPSQISCGSARSSRISGSGPTAGGWLGICSSNSRVPGQPFRVVQTVPESLPWAGGVKRSRRPKHGPKQKDLIERDVLWFYRHTLKRPPDTVYQLGKEWANRPGAVLKNESQHSTVESAIFTRQRPSSPVSTESGSYLGIPTALSRQVGRFHQGEDCRILADVMSKTPQDPTKAAQEIFYKRDLARVMQRSERTIERLQRSGKLPEPLPIPGRPSWSSHRFLDWLRSGGASRRGHR